MHEVRVYDHTGSLKKVISVKALKKRSDMIIDSPTLFRKSRGNEKSPRELIKLAATK